MVGVFVHIFDMCLCGYVHVLGHVNIMFIITSMNLSTPTTSSYNHNSTTALCTIEYTLLVVHGLTIAISTW